MSDKGIKIYRFECKPGCTVDGSPEPNDEHNPVGYHDGDGYENTAHVVGEAEYMVDEWSHDFGEWIYLLSGREFWMRAGDVETAVDFLNGRATNFYASECSLDGPSECVGLTDWYSESEYVDPYTGAVSRATAHLTGSWSKEEAREIYRRVMNRA